MIWINTETGHRTEGKNLELNGSIVFNPSEELLREAGYIPESEIVVEDPKVSEEELREQELELSRSQVKDECTEYYNESVLKYTIRSHFRWISLEDRIKYSYELNTFKEEGIAKVSYKGTEYSPERALEILRKLTVYEYLCKQVLEEHLTAINVSDAPEDYDYTEGYPKRPDFSDLS